MDTISGEYGDDRAREGEGKSKGKAHPNWIPYRRPDGKWYVDCGVVAGKRRQKSSARRAKVDAYVRDMRLLRDKPEMAVAEQRARDAGLSIPEAVEMAIRVREAERDAERVAAGRRVPEAVEAFLLSRREDGLAERTLEFYRNKLRPFAAAFGGRAVGMLAGGEIRDYAMARGRSPGGRNAMLRALRAATNYWIDEGWMAPGRLARKTFKKVREDKAPIDIIGSDDLRKMIEAGQGARPALRKFVPYIAVKGYTGARSCEVMRLDWSHVRWERGEIAVVTGKTRGQHRRMVPMPDALVQVLDPFRGSKGRICPVKSESAVYRALTKIAAIAGVALTHNCLRHSFASFQSAINERDEAVASGMGTSIKVLHSCYREIADSDEGRRWFAPPLPAGEGGEPGVTPAA